MTTIQDSAARIPIWAWPAALLAGAFLANAIPHGLMGVTGQAFPTPFSGGPPNLSPPLLNVVWSLINIAIGFGLLWLVRRCARSAALRWTAIAGAAIFALLLAVIFDGVVAGAA